MLTKAKTLIELESQITIEQVVNFFGSLHFFLKTSQRSLWINSARITWRRKELEILLY